MKAVSRCQTALSVAVIPVSNLQADQNENRLVNKWTLLYIMFDSPNAVSAGREGQL
jgi:hypothetical protein